jgi:hypothetical protein
MYLFHLISIDLELSRSFNPHTLQSLHLPMNNTLATTSTQIQQQTLPMYLIHELMHSA